MLTRRFFRVKLAAMLAAAMLPLSAAALDLAVMGSYWDAKDADNTWGVGAKVGIPLLTEFLEVQGRAYAYPDSSAGDTGEITFVPVDLGAAVQFLPDGTFNPAVMAGASYVFVDSSGRDSVDGNWGAYLGAGLEIGLGLGFHIESELLFRFVSLDYSDGFNDESFDANGLTANIGLGFRF